MSARRADRQTIQQAWATLLCRADAIADSITLALIEQEPAYLASSAPDIAAEIRRSTRDHIRQGLRTLAGAPAATDSTHEVWRRTGRERARQGIPMELVLKAYTLGSRTLWEELIRERERHRTVIDERLLLVAGQQLWRALDAQYETLVDAYRRESARMQQRDLANVLAVLDGLRSGRGGDPAFEGEVRSTLGLSASQDIGCVVGIVDDQGKPPLPAPEDALDQIGALSHWNIRDGYQFGLVALTSATWHAVVDALTPRAAGKVGVAHSPDGVSSFAAAYRLASLTAETFPDGCVGVALATDRLPRVIMAADDRSSDLLVHHALGSMWTHPEPQRNTLLSTLAHVLASDGSPTNAAKVLYCHRNTVIYRIRQIEDLTGRSLTDPRDRLLLTLALVKTGHWEKAVGTDSFG
ncbi:helix-turn-helix domain-containing protein [Rhodococcus sp. G-MC3]|uniref:helix-turn-helix domain-containing protein n=1 Tax=Rhodococcus sp. G-MC3 TaxID=3046209 RepID=UPI0024BBB664|nr:helix-turn-helix domain-containing protein [Rhodococcus sp. G-MC3]MDJ0395580.1 helix-turn-helix domain-containing protein [Rhodococcus sp. G-MC3]